MFRLIKTNPNRLKPCGYNLFIVAKGFETRDEAIKARLELKEKGKAHKTKNGWNVYIQQYKPKKTV
jgi:hypothetical protein